MLLINQRKLNISLISKSKTGVVCVRVSEFPIKYQAQGVLKSSLSLPDTHNLVWSHLPDLIWGGGRGKHSSGIKTRNLFVFKVRFQRPFVRHQHGIVFCHFDFLCVSLKTRTECQPTNHQTLKTWIKPGTTSTKIYINWHRYKYTH